MEADFSDLERGVGGSPGAGVGDFEAKVQPGRRLDRGEAEGLDPAGEPGVIDAADGPDLDIPVAGIDEHGQAELIGEGREAKLQRLRKNSSKQIRHAGQPICYNPTFPTNRELSPGRARFAGCPNEQPLIVIASEAPITTT